MSSTPNIGIDDKHCYLILQSFINCSKVRPDISKKGCEFLSSDIMQCVKARFTLDKEKKEVRIR